MALNSASTSMSLSWAQELATSGYNPVTQGPDSLSLSISPALTGSNPANVLYTETRTLSASGSYTYDFNNGSLSTLLGQALTMTRVFSIAISCSSGTIVYQPGATNGLEWFLGGTSPTITIPAGAGFLFSTPTHQVVSGTDKTITVSSAAGATYKIAIIGGQ